MIAPGPIRPEQLAEDLAPVADALSQVTGNGYTIMGIKIYQKMRTIVDFLHFQEAEFLLAPTPADLIEAKTGKKVDEGMMWFLICPSCFIAQITRLIGEDQFEGGDDSDLPEERGPFEDD